MSKTSTWKNCTKTNPCPLCLKPDWCSVSEDGEAVLCSRTEVAPTGWKFIKISVDNRNIFAKDDGKPTPSHRPRKPNPNKPNQNPTPKKPIPANLTVLRLLETADIPKTKPRHDNKLNARVLQTEYWYSDSQWVVRKEWQSEKGREKTFRQMHTGENGLDVPGKGDAPWPAYRQAEVLSLAANLETPAVLVVEGEKCVEILRGFGIAAITLQGSSWGKDAESIISQIQSAVPQLTLLLLPDHDKEGSRKMHKLATECNRVGLTYLAINPVRLLPDLPEKGDCVEIIEALGIEEFLARLEAEISLEIEMNCGSGRVDEENSMDEDDFEDEEVADKKKELTPTQKGWECLVKIFGDRVRWNEMTLRVEIDGKPAKDIEQLYLDLEIDHNIQYLGKERVYDLMIRLAKTNKYHPVKEYLERVSLEFDPINIDNLATRFFKTTHPIYDAMVKAHLIGSVKRIYEPGCKKDEALILQGAQGIYKSTFFRTLYGQRFFSDSLKGTDRDNLLILHQFWCLEMAELESITGKKEAGDLKAFITSQEDTFRPPYGKVSEPHERQSVLVGTVNPQNFLQDETGNRRFWVIPVKYRINIREVEELRNAIWSAAVAAYRRGESHCLTYEQEEIVNELNRNYIQEDAWETLIDNYLVGREQTTILEIAVQALMFENSKVDKRSQQRIASILKNLGWEKTTLRYQGKIQKIWYLSDTKSVTNSELVTGLVTVGNVDTVRVLPTLPTKTQNLEPEKFDDDFNDAHNQVASVEIGENFDNTHNQNNASPEICEIVGNVGNIGSQQALPTCYQPVTNSELVTLFVSTSDTKVDRKIIKELTGCTNWSEVVEFLRQYSSDERSLILKSLPSGEVTYLEKFIPPSLGVKGSKNRLMRAIALSLPVPEEKTSTPPGPVPDPELEKIFPFGCRVRKTFDDGTTEEGEVYKHMNPFLGYRFPANDVVGGWNVGMVHKDEAVRVI